MHIYISLQKVHILHILPIFHDQHRTKTFDHLITNFNCDILQILKGNVTETITM
jgi:hypothetical protein